MWLARAYSPPFEGVAASARPGWFRYFKLTHYQNMAIVPAYSHKTLEISLLSRTHAFSPLAAGEDLCHYPKKRFFLPWFPKACGEVWLENPA